jgi:hypothetical protein
MDLRRSLFEVTGDDTALRLVERVGSVSQCPGYSQNPVGDLALLFLQ